VLYPSVLGESWAQLPEAVRAMHLDGRPRRGLFRVRRGGTVSARLLARILGLPAAGSGVSVRLQVRVAGESERWERTFGSRLLLTTQYPGPEGLLAERFGAVELRFRLEARGGALVYRSMGAVLRLGPARVPLPRWLAPSVRARERGAEGGVTVRVGVTSPFTGPLVAYAGRLGPPRADEP
jgi:hypothetical protein